MTSTRGVLWVKESGTMEQRIIRELRQLQRTVIKPWLGLYGYMDDRRERRDRDRMQAVIEAMSVIVVRKNQTQ